MNAPKPLRLGVAAVLLAVLLAPLSAGAAPLPGATTVGPWQLAWRWVSALWQGAGALLQSVALGDSSPLPADFSDAGPAFDPLG